MTAGQMHHLRKETEDIFFHGFENYMKYAFPEDELRPISCTPLTRDRENPAHIEVNDALGNYSVTLIDSLSTLAILASSPSTKKSRNKALDYFQDGVRNIVKYYGDGSDGPKGEGIRARGFDLDSKIQVFETVIRGVGGLLSAHLFAVGELPIRGYTPPPAEVALAQTWNREEVLHSGNGIRWTNGFIYDGQLLRLAHDLADRLIPAFYTATGLPYPRVNLRSGIPFYANSPLNFDPEEGQCGAEGANGPEITETCSAGAGSLVLEFTLLSRLTGDTRFEDLAKRAFWAVWNRKSDIGLIGAGIDAENGQWNGPFTGIGASVDSFFEYAFKSHILLSRDSAKKPMFLNHTKDPRQLFVPLSNDEHSASAFLDTWKQAHAAIKRHLYRGHNYQHPHYIQGDLFTGAARLFWIDSLSAYYPGLLTLSGELDEAVEVHLLATALWTRYSALPERWNAATGDIDGGLGWWGGRPEFIESTWYLYRATQDPWYLYTAEMTLRDIKRRCWTKCGWAGLQNVQTGELSDRMESFFLGETTKYLFLLFDSDHPLNKLDEPVVFTTEGHPVVIPRNLGYKVPRPSSRTSFDNVTEPQFCPAPPPPIPLSVSNTAARADVYHAAALARLHLMPSRDQLESPLQEYAADHPSIFLSDVRSPTNYTHYPWTLPPNLIPSNATSSRMPARPTFDISFPSLPSLPLIQAPLQRVRDGILINSIGGIRFGMIQDGPMSLGTSDDLKEGFRIQVINNLALGKDEKVFLAKDTTTNVVNPADPNFTHVRDPGLLDIVADIPTSLGSPYTSTSSSSVSNNTSKIASAGSPAAVKSALVSFVSHLSSLLHSQEAPSTSIAGSPIGHDPETGVTRYYLTAITPTGPGVAAIPDWSEAPSPSASGAIGGSLLWTSIYVADFLCDERLPGFVPRKHHVILVRRGQCSFSQKLANIPAFVRSPQSLQLVIVVSFDSKEDGLPEGWLIRPHLDEEQKTPGGFIRREGIPMVMVGGGAEAWEGLKKAKSIGLKRRYTVQAQGVPISNLIVI
ncbi:MAG: hypothetical protein Q9160_000526 [Pyrenula sp. 1 TL-2023]